MTKDTPSSRRKVMTGRVVGDKMQKTVIVEIEQRHAHPLYGKVVTKARRFKAQNDDPVAQLGDTVKIVESRPYSREKRFRVAEIVQRGVLVEEIVEKELESLRVKEESERAARRAEEERRASDRLSKLAGEPEAEETEEASEAPEEGGGAEE